MTPESERLARDFRAFIADCEALLGNAKTLTGEGTAVLRSEFNHKIAEARVRLDELKVATSERAVRARGATEDYVRREPLKALCAAAAVGAVVALLVSRR
jgi:ElaB/YqjD/DUF883 family membrane-anchored ribosome-binding protein